MAGFRKAWALGVDGIELDVFQTADGRLVVFHDEQTERLTGVKGNITQMTWDEVSRLRIRRKLDMGAGQLFTYAREEPIPLLEQVLDEFRDKLLINIEMKAYAPSWSRRHTGTGVARLIREAGAHDAVIVTSFDFFMLLYLERECPGLQSGFAYDDGIMAGAMGDWLKRVPEIATDLSQAPGNQNDLSILNWVLETNAVGALTGATVVDIEHQLIDRDTVNKFHARDMLVGAYTLFPLDTRSTRVAGDPDFAALRMADEEVDWVETDDPERLMELYARR